MNSQRILGLLLLLFFVASLMSGCTIFRDRENNGNGDGDGSGDVELEPKVVDVLVLVDLPRGAANIMSGYAEYLSLVQVALLTQNVEVRKFATAPLYRTQGSGTPLLHGVGDEYSPFSGIGEALAYYVSDEGRSHLTGERDFDGENLADLGRQLDTKPIFNPFFTPPEVVPYFDEAADGLVVFYFTGSSRRCAYDSDNCRIEGQRAAHFFTDVDDDTGFASWLRLPGETGLEAHRIVHIAVATAEGIDFDAFSTRCRRETNFPANYLDVLEPSTVPYFRPFIDDLRREGGHGEFIDLCTVLSDRKTRAAANTAGRVVQMLR